MQKLLHKDPSIHQRTSLVNTFFLQIRSFIEWAMLGSNQRPLPCESETCSFVKVRRYPISAFLGLIARYSRHGRSLSFAPVVVKLSSAA
jgi:hypothetical protein